MAGTFIVNLVFSLLGFSIYFPLSYSRYYPFETFFHSLVVGLVFWISGYIVRYLFGKAFQSNEQPIDVPLVGESFSTGEIPIKENEQPLSENDLEQVSKYIKGLINNE